MGEVHLFLKIWLNYITGYIKIKVESFFLERFLNICIGKRIFLWNIKRKKSTILYANISIRDYRRLKNIAKKTKSRIKIEAKKGMPFILHKYRKRKIFIGFLILMLIGLITTSNFIWNIEIEGNEQITKEDLMESLNQNGIKIGTNKNKIDTNLIINKIRLQRDDIAWMGINIKGTNAIIEIKEANKAPEIVNENDYCNIVSNKNGCITKISVQNGTASVSVRRYSKRWRCSCFWLYGRKVYWN